MAPEILSALALVVSIFAGGYAIHQQRYRGIRPSDHAGDLAGLRLQNERLSKQIEELSQKQKTMATEQAATEQAFRRQVLVMVAELEETRTSLTTTRYELSAALDEIDRLRTRLTEVGHASNRPGLPTPGRRIRVLAIWPDTPHSPLRLETQSIQSSGVQVTSLTGEVTRRDILRELRRAAGQTSYNVIHIGSHGKPTEPDQNQTGGILLSQGDLVPAQWWGDIAKEYHIQAAVLMVCHGDDVADALRRGGVGGVVSVQEELEDRAALAFSFALYENLADGLGLAEAVKQATWAVKGDQARLIRLIGVDPWGEEGRGARGED